MARIREARALELAQEISELMIRLENLRVQLEFDEVESGALEHLEDAEATLAAAHAVALDELEALRRAAKERRERAQRTPAR
jgi:hypothetical protein